MKNGTLWKDTDGNAIQAHGGMILEHEGTYYWYGEHKGAPNCPGTTRVDIIGVSCYSSSDLMQWKYEGLVIKADRTDPAHPLYYRNVCERPKILYCKQTGKLVLWMHLLHAGRYWRYCSGFTHRSIPSASSYAAQSVGLPGYDGVSGSGWDSLSVSQRKLE